MRLGHRLATPTKSALGLVFNGLSCIVMMFAAPADVGAEKVSPLWLVAAYAVEVTGELCPSPVGPSTPTKPAVKNLRRLMAGIH
ncbi:hypothetical protein AB0I28_04000 [Phytomonospora sp. NPDC050363]|uniref:hypothetical protein n=1 Tax=Phytomonospora sp. NPDC050363 TaxID=3155642 RepID=UPI0033CB59BA